MSKSMQTASTIYIHFEFNDTSTAPSDGCRKCCPNILSNLQIIPKATNTRIRASTSQSQLPVTTVTTHTHMNTRACTHTHNVRTIVESNLTLSCQSAGKNLLPLGRFSENLKFAILWKSVKQIKVLLKSDKNNGYFTWRPCLAHFFLEWEMFHTKVVEKITTQSTFNKCFQKIMLFLRYSKLRMVEPDRPQMTI
jgi:hypothetical protein